MSIQLYSQSLNNATIFVDGAARLTFAPAAITIPNVILTGNATAPTPTQGDNSTSISTTAFTTTAVSTAIASIVINPNWIVKTTTYQAVANDAIMANTTAGVFTVTLPINPPLKTVVRIADYAGTFASNNLTVARNGQNIMGLAQNLTLDLNNASITLTYIDVTQGWRLV